MVIAVAVQSPSLIERERVVVRKSPSDTVQSLRDTTPESSVVVYCT
jgi:hypothetical protein